MSNSNTADALAAPRRRPRPLLWVFLALALAGATAGAWKYYSFYFHTTRQESTGAVKRGSLTANLRGQSVKLLVYQQEKAVKQPLVFFTSGDGGWSPFCADIAAHLAEKGKTVVAFDVKNYLTTFHSPDKPATTEQLTQDYQELINAALTQSGVDQQQPVTLAGWSLGAGYSALIASQDAMKPRIGRVLAVSLPIYNQLAWKATDSVIYLTHGVPDEKTFDAREVVGKLAPVPLYLFNATDDDTAPLTAAQDLFNHASEPKKLYAATARGHHFEGGETEFYQKLDESFAVK